MTRHLIIMSRLALLVTASLVAGAAMAASTGPSARAATGSLRSVDAVAPGATVTPVLVELFTSEGCSSCPPADRLLTTLQRDQPVPGALVIALSEHVDYWNGQGWPDPFSSRQFTDRQNDYGRRLDRDTIYTPQLVVDGTVDVVGSDGRAVRRAIADAARLPKAIMRLAIRNRSASRVDVRAETELLDDVKGPVDAWVALTEDDLTVKVLRGENARRTLHHTAVVRALIAGATTLDGPRLTASASLEIAPAVRRKNIRVVAFAQSRATGRVVAVGWLPAD